MIGLANLLGQIGVCLKIEKLRQNAPSVFPEFSDLALTLLSCAQRMPRRVTLLHSGLRVCLPCLAIGFQVFCKECALFRVLRFIHCTGQFRVSGISIRMCRLSGLRGHAGFPFTFCLRERGELREFAGRGG